MQACHHAVMSTFSGAFIDQAIIQTAAWGIFIPVALVLLTLARSKDRRAAFIEAALSGALTIAIVKMGALFFDHARPFVTLHIQPLIAHAADNAFPSDHAAAAGLAAAYLWPRSRALAIVAFVAACAIGVARVAAHLHWPIDIIAGIAFGVAGGTLGAAIVRRAYARRDDSRSIGIIATKNASR